MIALSKYFLRIKTKISTLQNVFSNLLFCIIMQSSDRVKKGVDLLLAEQQIQKAFEQSEKEVQDLHERTREGIREAKRNGKQVGRAAGARIITKKSLEAKKLIQNYSKDFGGTLNDIDTMVQIRARVGTLSRNS